MDQRNLLSCFPHNERWAFHHYHFENKIKQNSAATNSFPFPCLQPERRPSTLKEQLGLVTPLLEDLRAKKEERLKKFTDIKGHIEKISREINGYAEPIDTVTPPDALEEHDLSLKKLNEYQIHLQALQKEKVRNLDNIWTFSLFSLQFSSGNGSAFQLLGEHSWILRIPSVKTVLYRIVYP